VHPGVPCLSLSAICPQSLSFRPILLPADMRLQLQLSAQSRAQEADITVDGYTMHGMSSLELLTIWIRRPVGMLRQWSPERWDECMSTSEETTLLPSRLSDDFESDQALPVDSVEVGLSPFPVPCVERGSLESIMSGEPASTAVQALDWIHDISHLLKWNQAFARRDSGKE
jgi:hypothetical protein